MAMYRGTQHVLLLALVCASTCHALKTSGYTCIRPRTYAQFALPCKSPAGTQCMFNVQGHQTDGSAWDWLRGSNADFVIVKDAVDVQNYMQSDPYNAIKTGLDYHSNEQFKSGWFPVPAGKTYIFLVYSYDVWDTQTLKYNIWAFPNFNTPPLMDFSNHAVSTKGTKQLTITQEFVLGMVFGYRNTAPFLVPPQEHCLDAARDSHISIYELDQAYESGSTSQMINAFRTQFNSAKAVFQACTVRQCSNSLPVQLLTEVASHAIDYIPGLNLVKAGEEVVQITIDGIDIISDYKKMMKFHREHKYMESGTYAGQIARRVVSAGRDARNLLPLAATAPQNMAYHGNETSFDDYGPNPPARSIEWWLQNTNEPSIDNSQSPAHGVHYKSRAPHSSPGVMSAGGIAATALGSLAFVAMAAYGVRRHRRGDRLTFNIGWRRLNNAAVDHQAEAPRARPRPSPAVQI